MITNIIITRLDKGCPMAHPNIDIVLEMHDKLDFRTGFDTDPMRLLERTLKTILNHLQTNELKPTIKTN
jgi:DNA-directed RNA polymerase subunit L